MNYKTSRMTSADVPLIFQSTKVTCYDYGMSSFFVSRANFYS